MSDAPLRFASKLDAPIDTVWASISTMRGVNYEMSPLFRMTSPKVTDDMNIADAPLGIVAFPSWLLLFRLLPIDRHALTLVEVDLGHGFLEDSTSLMQRRWRHERRLVATPDGGCTVTDELLFVPRLPFFAPLIRFIASRLFTHRHARLQKRFGGSPISA